MATFFPKPIPANWYKYDAHFSIHLLRTYIDIVEEGVQKSIEAFNKDKQVLIAEGLPEEGHYIASEEYRGIDDSTFDLEGIFEGFFPNLQRAAGLMTLFSFFENELEKLCHLYVSSYGMRVVPKDMHGSGMERSVLFLEKIVGLPIDKGSATWYSLRNIQRIRNRFAHAGGKTTDSSGKPIKEVVATVEASDNLGDDDGDIILGSEYLVEVVASFDSLFQQLDELNAKHHEDMLKKL